MRNYSIYFMIIALISFFSKAEDTVNPSIFLQIHENEKQKEVEHKKKEERENDKFAYCALLSNHDLIIVQKAIKGILPYFQDKNLVFNSQIYTGPNRKEPDSGSFNIELDQLYLNKDIVEGIKQNNQKAMSTLTHELAHWHHWKTNPGSMHRKDQRLENEDHTFAEGFAVLFSAKIHGIDGGLPEGDVYRYGCAAFLDEMLVHAESEKEKRKLVSLAQAIEQVYRDGEINLLRSLCSLRC